jgi:hypothetical protein
VVKGGGEWRSDRVVDGVTQRNNVFSYFGLGRIKQNSGEEIVQRNAQRVCPLLTKVRPELRILVRLGHIRQCIPTHNNNNNNNNNNISTKQ